MPSPLTLLPPPRLIERKSGGYRIKPRQEIALLGVPAGQLLFSAERLRDVLNQADGGEWTLAATRGDATGIVLRVAQIAGAPAESYTLDITPATIEIVAPTPRGIFYGVCTLIQIIEQSPRAGRSRRLPALRIADAPDFPNRGVMLDISRTRVPTQQTLFDLIDLLASWKINQVQLYTEHTFAYRRHRVVWQDASPLTAQDILELDAFCRERYIELVPNQNSFGHMHRWLRHPEYEYLAEDHAGFTDTKSHWWAPAPFGLNPTDPRTLDFIRELYDELLPNFRLRSSTSVWTKR